MSGPDAIDLPGPDLDRPRKMRVDNFAGAFHFASILRVIICEGVQQVSKKKIDILLTTSVRGYLLTIKRCQSGIARPRGLTR